MCGFASFTSSYIWVAWSRSRAWQSSEKWNKKKRIETAFGFRGSLFFHTFFFSPIGSWCEQTIWIKAFTRNVRWGEKINFRTREKRANAAVFCLFISRNANKLIWVPGDIQFRMWNFFSISFFSILNDAPASDELKTWPIKRMRKKEQRTPKIVHRRLFANTFQLAESIASAGAHIHIHTYNRFISLACTVCTLTCVERTKCNGKIHGSDDFLFLSFFSV